ncbi:MAG TPA: hypothetical protein VM554_01610 [Acidisarcina sp.]|nr:hypothetical protein [Acidisarcina sp.]
MASYVVDTVESKEPGTIAGADSAVHASAVKVFPGAAEAVPEKLPAGFTGIGTGVAAVRGRRRIPPVAGHALEKLGHAIEYLTDEYVHEGCAEGFTGPQLAAIQLLMALNREVYYECPVIPPLWVRIREFLRRAIGD